MKRQWLAGMVLGSLVLWSTPAFAQEEENKQQPKRSIDVLTADEIAEHGNFQTAWDAVKQLRPFFLSGAHAQFGGRIPLYIDGVQGNEWEDLKGLLAADVLEIRRWNLNSLRYPPGSIVVTTRPSVPPPG